jgi:hypothetical protein
VHVLEEFAMTYHTAFDRRVWILFSVVVLGWLSGCNCESHPADITPPITQPDERDGQIVLGPCLKVEPIAFGGYPLGCVDPLLRPLKISHTNQPNCPTTIQVKQATFTGADASDFRLQRPKSFPLNVKVGEPAYLNLRFQTSKQAPINAQVTLTTNLEHQPKLTAKLTGEGTRNLEHIDTFKQEAKSSDILFVIDNSCSMRQEQRTLTLNFASFIQWAQKLNADFQIGVIATDMETPKAACLVGDEDTRILTPRTPNLFDAFSKNARLGINGDPTETGIHAAYTALQPKRLNDPSCNKGFLRKDANLSLIFVSDEPDGSKEEVDYYVKAFQQIKGEGREHLVRASAVVGPETDYCQSIYGTAEAGPRYIELTKKLSGVHALICSPNWSENLKAIGLASVLTRLHFPLSQRANGRTIQVFVDDKQIPASPTNGWQHDPTTNRISFRGTSIPLPGATVQIKYFVNCPEP